MARFNPFEKLNCAFGAPMGRHSTRHDFCGVKRFAVSRPQGEYDCGGAYWGSGGREGPVWAVWECGDGLNRVLILQNQLHTAIHRCPALHCTYRQTGP